MITIPLYWFLFLFLFFLLGFLAFVSVNIGHLVRTGTFTLVSFFATFFFFTYTIIVLFFALQFLSPVNWQATLTTFSFASFSNTSIITQPTL